MPAADIRVHENQVVLVEMLEEIPVRRDVLYTNEKGAAKPSVQKRTSKMLRNLSAGLKRVLQPKEVVLYAMPARSPLSVLAQLTATFWIAMLAACAVVVTNQHILFSPVKRGGKWRESVRLGAWGDLEEIKPKGLLAKIVTIRPRDGAKNSFANVRLGDGKKIAEITATLLPAAASEQTSAHGIVQLCPDCRGLLTAGNYQCPGCGLIFKNEKTMELRSIFLPGGGYFYTGHPLVAILPVVVEAIFLLDVLAILVVGFSSPKAAPELMRTVAILAVFWVVEAAFTILHCRRFVREFIPVRRSSAGIPQNG